MMMNVADGRLLDLMNTVTQISQAWQTRECKHRLRTMGFGKLTQDELAVVG